MRKINTGCQVAIRRQMRTKRWKAAFLMQIPVDIGMVEFDAGEKWRCAGGSKNFGPLSKKAVSYSSPSTTKRRRCGLIVSPEVPRNTANHVAGVNPADSRTQASERCSGRLAVRARDHDRMAITQKKLRQGLREGEKGEALREHRLYFGV